MIAAIYARKSTEQNGVADDQKSVARQVEHARAYAEAKGWTVAEAHVYVDDGISGAEFANRPGFLRLMNALKPRPPFEALVMSEESRLGREQIEVSYALKQLVQAGVRVFSYMNDSERTLDSPIEKAMLALQTMADEMERAKAATRTSDAMMRKARSGFVTGGRCFGYRNVEVQQPDGRRSHVVREIDPGEAAVVREIFELCAKGIGRTRIAKLLNERGAVSPLATQGRPKSWAPSSVHAILYRDAYRGVLVYNKSKKRDSWGQQKRKHRPKAEWVEVPAPELRIVSDKLWAAAHARLDASKQTYLRQQNGRLWGRPPSGVASKYLLTGIARCGHCGAGLEVRSRSHGSRRAFFYSCSSYYRRGPSVCPNRYEIPMKAADALVIETLLSEILTPARVADVAARALALARQRNEEPGARERVERQLAETETALARLTAAVAAGGDVPALVEAIKAQEGQRKALAARLATLSAPPVEFDPATEQRLQKAVEEWRAVLGRQVAQARQIVQKLLAEKLTFTPAEREGERGFVFRATGTVERLVSGAVPGSLQAVVPPTGFEPVFAP